MKIRPIVSVLIECEGRTYRVIDNLRTLLVGAPDRYASENRIGKPILDLARQLDARSEPVIGRKE